MADLEKFASHDILASTVWKGVQIFESGERKVSSVAYIRVSLQFPANFGPDLLENCVRGKRYLKEMNFSNEVNLDLENATSIDFRLLKEWNVIWRGLIANWQTNLSPQWNMLEQFSLYLGFMLLYKREGHTYHRDGVNSMNLAIRIYWLLYRLCRKGLKLVRKCNDVTSLSNLLWNDSGRRFKKIILWLAFAFLIWSYKL